ncbi:unnamed protein product (macronuclear) [Paramecium tetraurelia]|uniref:non-specific serine/threonine protein kinase n=1 Tax=Paramecium tetraurelia TaxID=5888 RepID=A0CIE7_PARTE|nr:uncharacterized protein GSPATT00007699001 [Paramecium tetraurelia]CAK70564.1 unnamed protein product [Paramecium tetraurelia]|eukprot:XP_001437961.1 hypothetical protein (macronuclear) [Paramecium tetraurelia strain d4-2]
MSLNLQGSRKPSQVNSPSSIKKPMISSLLFNCRAPINVPNSSQVSPQNSEQNLLKRLHSHKGSQVDVTNLTKLIKHNKSPTIEAFDTQNNENSSSQQLQALLAKAREITQNKQKPQIVKQQAQAIQTQSINQLKELFNNNLYCRNTFHFHFVVGIGGFGKVWKVEHKKTSQIYAMKEMSKALYVYSSLYRIITKKSVNSVMNERILLSQLKHPFLVNMNYAYQDRETLYLIMDYMSGGDLRYHIGRMRKFNEEETSKKLQLQFLRVLQYVHGNNIIHRDLKPENLVLDSKGYVHLTDFGIARFMKSENSSDTSGTPGYMAPEVMYRQNHTFAVDYYALGVIAYEFMLGRRPYVGRSRQEIREQIIAKQVQIKKSEIPDNWSLEGADFINRLLQRKPSQRLGFIGSQEIRQHPWFLNFPWQKLQDFELIPPFKPNVNGYYQIRGLRIILIKIKFSQRMKKIMNSSNKTCLYQKIRLLKGYEFNANQSHNKISSTTDQSSSSSSKHSRNFSQQIEKQQFCESSNK